MRLTAVFAIVTLVAGEQMIRLGTRQEDPSTFLRRFYHGSFVLGKTLYIDGGEFSWKNGTDPAQQILNQTLVISLSQSFDTVSSSNTINPAVINKGGCPDFNLVRFWYDKDATRAYAYGGEYSQLNPWEGPGTVPANNLWSFVPLDPGPGGSWQLVDTTANGGWQRILRSSGGAVASGDGIGYGLGGYFNAWTDESHYDLGGAYLPAPGMEICNITSNSCTKDPATGYSTNGTFEFGGLIQVPNWGTQGLVFVVGGQTSPSLDNFASGQKYQDLSNISVYEPTGQKWYYQTSTGDVPTARDRFCVVGTSESQTNNGTFEIFLYGGQYGSSTFTPDQTVTDEVYVLSLPAFQWFRANYTPSDNRILHTCHALGRQMLSIGGLDPSASSFEDAIENSDGFTEGIKVFDMVEMQWTNKWDASVPDYRTPDAVQSFYASVGNGPAAWDMPELQAIFNGTAKLGETGTPASSKPKKSHTGAIIGGVVGGVVLILICGVAFYRLYWRKKHPSSMPEQIEMEKEATGGLSGAAEMGVAGNEIGEVESPPAELPTKDAQAWELPSKDQPSSLNPPAELP